MRILFVCLGNICRSPSAEAVMRARIAAAGLSAEIALDSAGTGDWHVGRPADARAIAAGAERGIEVDSIARQVRSSDFADFDLIVAMDAANEADLLAWEGCDPARIRMMREFCCEGRADVPDPYYEGEEAFEEMLDILERSCDALLDWVRPRVEAGV